MSVGSGLDSVLPTSMEIIRGHARGIQLFRCAQAILWAGQAFSSHLKDVMEPNWPRHGSELHYGVFLHKSP